MVICPSSVMPERTQIDDGKASVAETHEALGVTAVTVRSAMGQQVAHLADDGRINRRLRSKVHPAGNATHVSNSLFLAR
jgi:hypothetical protein